MLSTSGSHHAVLEANVCTHMQCPNTALWKHMFKGIWGGVSTCIAYYTGTF